MSQRLIGAKSSYGRLESPMTGWRYAIHGARQTVIIRKKIPIKSEEKIKLQI